MTFDIFLDRDGSLIRDTGYISSIDDVEIIGGVVKGLLLFKNIGCRLHIVSNQSGVPRGKVTLKEFKDIEMYVNQLFLIQDLEFDSLNYCFHLPTDGCDCRKPKTGLLKRASEVFNIEKANAAMLGNAEVDRKAAENFGIPFWKVGESENDFYEAAQEVIQYFERP